jgi:hypothetical protein
MTNSINHPRRLALLALSCLPGGRSSRPVRVGLAGRTRYRIMVAGLKRAREEAGGAARLAVKASAALALSLRVFVASVWEALRAGRTAPVVTRPEPVRNFQRLPLPVVEAPAATTPPHRQEEGRVLFVASPRKDGRRPSKVRMTYRPFTGQPLKDGEFLAAKEGRRYRRVEPEEQAAA